VVHDNADDAEYGGDPETSVSNADEVIVCEYEALLEFQRFDSPEDPSPLTGRRQTTAKERSLRSSAVFDNYWWCPFRLTMADPVEQAAEMNP
jgi:hypothetical protein